MSSESTIILFGFLTLITPFLGFPYAWYGYLFPLWGIVIIAAGASLRMRRYRQNARARMDSPAQMPSDTSSQESSLPHGPSPLA